MECKYEQQLVSSFEFPSSRFVLFDIRYSKNKKEKRIYKVKNGIWEFFLIKSSGSLMKFVF